VSDDWRASVGDPLSRPFWEGAQSGVLRIQRCTSCGSHQFYPRPFCLKCQSDVEWVAAAGTGTVYSRTVVRLQVSADLVPPYSVGIVELDEGPHITANLQDIDIGIGERVVVGWRHRVGLPPYPMFQRVGDSTGGRLSGGEPSGFR